MEPKFNTASPDKTIFSDHFTDHWSFTACESWFVICADPASSNGCRIKIWGCMATVSRNLKSSYCTIFFPSLFIYVLKIYFVNIKIKIVYFFKTPHSHACKIISAAAHENNTLGKTWGTLCDHKGYGLLAFWSEIGDWFWPFFLESGVFFYNLVLNVKCYF